VATAAFRAAVAREFAIVFRNTSAKTRWRNLESLRQIIEKSTFQVRGSEEEPRGAEGGSDRRTSESDRRKPRKRKLFPRVYPGGPIVYR
jgi:hypothetical protein